ncbi:MAG: hypothetical protein H6739_22575 [Alphaproteobacteria bacterium]|nr:hypothetical protein [Alphaproteobacteria bacterium]
MGTFRCPDCGTPSLEICRALRIPPDGWSDDLSLQAIACAACGMKGVAAYEETRHGRGESFHHRGLRLSEADHAALLDRLGRCTCRSWRAPGPCEAHDAYNRVQGHAWLGLQMFQGIGASFRMELISSLKR